MQAVSSSTTTPPEPSIDPVFATESKSMATSISSGRRTGVDEPPGTTAFNSPVRNSAADVIDHLLKVVAHRQFVDTRLVKIPRETKQPRAAILGRTELRVPVRAPQHNMRHCGQRLRVINHCRPTP